MVLTFWDLSWNDWSHSHAGGHWFESSSLHQKNAGNRKISGAFIYFSELFGAIKTCQKWLITGKATVGEKEVFGESTPKTSFFGYSVVSWWKSCGLCEPLKHKLPSVSSIFFLQLLLNERTIHSSTKWMGACVTGWEEGKTFDRWPDLDNANVGSHFTRFFTGGIQRDVSCFLFTTEYAGSLYHRLRGRRGLRPDNLIWIMPT